jgi:hypothetical protein
MFKTGVFIQKKIRFVLYRGEIHKKNYYALTMKSYCHISISKSPEVKAHCVVEAKLINIPTRRSTLLFLLRRRTSWLGPPHYRGFTITQTHNTR